MKSIKTIAVKIGSNVLTGRDGLPNLKLVAHIVDQVGSLMKQQISVVLISSGAVAAGRSIFKTNKKLETVIERQLLSSLGQVKLIQTYNELFAKKDLLSAQVLVTKQDFRDRHHYLNMKNCLMAMIQNNIVPIINENDAISITELMFTDNDELAGLVSSMLNVDALYILTNVDGLFDGDPSSKSSKLIRNFEGQAIQPESITSRQKSNFGRGGILTKCNTALQVSKMGIPVVIANGFENDIITRLCNGEAIGTLFKPVKNTSGVKKWLANSQSHAKGEVTVNAGAKTSLLSQRATSLLPVGITAISGEFKKGDVIRIIDDQGKEIGLGMAKYGDKKARSILGEKNQRPLVHYDYLFLH